MRVGEGARKCACIWIHAHMNAHMQHALTHAFTHANMHAHIQNCTHKYDIQRTHTSTHTCTHTRERVPILTRTATRTTFECTHLRWFARARTGEVARPESNEHEAQTGNTVRVESL